MTLSKLGRSEKPDVDNDPVYLARGLQRIGDLVLVQQYKQNISGVNCKYRRKVTVIETPWRS